MNLDSDYIYPLSKTRKALLSYLNSSIPGIDTMKDKLIQDFEIKIKTLISEFNENYKVISALRGEYIALIKNIIETSKITSNSKKLVDKILCLPVESALESLLQIPFISKGIELGLDPPPEYSDNKIVVFQNATKTLMEINLSNLKLAKIDLNLKNVISDHIIMCELPENQIFCYGDWEPAGTAFIIDAEYNIIELDDGKPCWYTFATLIKDSIYIFGGLKAKKQISSYAVKFNLQTANWNDLSPLPSPSTSVSALAVSNHIWLSGYHHQKLYCYSIDKNQYQEYLDLTLNTNKFICIGENLSIYVIESGGRIIKGESDGNDWQLVGTALPFNDIISYGKSYMGFTYFLDIDYILYAFNLAEENIDMIKQFN